LGGEQVITLEIGTVLDRFGTDFGFFLGKDSTFDQRSLPSVKPDSNCVDSYKTGLETHAILYNVYKVTKPFKVETCQIAPAFGHAGLGMQYRLFTGSIDDVNDIARVEEKSNSPEGKPGLKVPNVKEMVTLGYLEEMKATDPPPFN